MLIAHDPKLEIEEQDVEELFYMHDRELTPDKPKELFKQQCEESKMRLERRNK